MACVSGVSLSIVCPRSVRAVASVRAPPPPPFRGRATLPFVDGTLCPSCAFGLLRILPLEASEAGFGVDARFPLPWVDTDKW